MPSSPMAGRMTNTEYRAIGTPTIHIATKVNLRSNGKVRARKSCVSASASYKRISIKWPVARRIPWATAWAPKVIWKAATNNAICL